MQGSTNRALYSIAGGERRNRGGTLSDSMYGPSNKSEVLHLQQG